MRTEVGDALGSVFEAPAKAAPGRPPPDNEDPRSKGKPRLQRLCTRAKQRVWRGVVKKQWPSLIRRVLCGRHRTSTSRGFSSPHFRPLRRGRWAWRCAPWPPPYIGIDGPFLVHDKGLVLRDRNSAGGHLFQTVGTFGDSLSMHLGTGHGSFTLHSELEHLTYRIDLLVGMSLAGSRWTCSARPSTREDAKRGTPHSAKPQSSTAVASFLTSSSGRSASRAGTPSSLTRVVTGRRSE